MAANSPKGRPTSLDGWFDVVKEAGYPSDKETWLGERRKAQTDLFWLSRTICGLDLLDHFFCPFHPIESQAPEQGSCPECLEQLQPCPGLPEENGAVLSIHRQICDLFVHKNPDKSIAEQDTTKERMLMVPRGIFKTSIDEIDILQWIVCFPNIRVSLITATEDLGVAMVEMVKRRFTIEEDAAGNKTYTRFQLLFPEHVITAKNKVSEELFTTAARTDRTLKEPTLHALSLGGTKSGWHYEVGKADDCVSDKNSGPGTTQDQRDVVLGMINLLRGCIMPYGYRDYIGTPYDASDAYAAKLSTAVDGSIRLLRKPALARKKVSRGKKEAECGETDFDLLFPFDGGGKPQLTYGFLMGVKRDDIKVYTCQYLCQPTSAMTVKFTEDLLRSHITQPEGLPQAGLYDICMAWDFAASDGRGSDFSVGTVGYFDVLGRMYIVEIVRGRFDKTELAYQVAHLAYRWRPTKIGIEKSPGADFLENDIVREAIKMGYKDFPMPEWFTVDATKGAKENRAGNTELLLTSNRLWFLSEIGIIEDVIREFTNFKPGSKRKDDIVDSVGHLARFLANPIDLPKTEKERNEVVAAILYQKQLHDMIYRVGVPEKAPPPPPQPETPKVYEGMPVFGSYEDQLLGR